MAKRNRLDFLLREIEDPYVQESLYKLKIFLDNLQADEGLVGPRGPQGPPGPQGPAAVDAESATKLKVTRTAGEDILASEIVRASSATEVLLATGDTSNKEEAQVFGVAEADALLGEDVDIILLGVITDSAFSVFNVNDPLFLDADGGITNVKRLSGFHVPIGKALGGDDILFQAANPIVIG